MIITESKNREDLLQYLKPHQSVFIIGCGDCATSTQTGGEKETIDMRSWLEQRGFTVTGTAIIPTCCDQRQTTLALKKEPAQVAEVILVMACGSGSQTIVDCTDKPVIGALDSMFLGKIKNLRSFYERCQLCGECVANEFGGICPITRCAKSLLNGPCGGSMNNKCEVHPSYPCGWVLIYERMKALGRLDDLRKFQPQKDYSKIIRPRSLEIQ